MADHWSATLNKALVRENPRRTLLQAAAASLGLAALPESGMGKKGKNGKKGNKGKHNDRGKDKKKDRLVHSVSGRQTAMLRRPLH